MRLYLVALVALAALVAAEEWSAGNFPNPTAGEFQKCGMKTSANICDPDGVLSESARYRLDHDLKQLESRTRQENAPSFCDKKGVTAAMAIARHVKGGSEAAVREMANDMLRRWTLDPQCQKAIVIVVSTDDMKFWVARDDKVPVYAEEFTELFMSQRNNFQQSNYQGALTNILQGTWEKAISKQGSPKLAPGSGGGGGGGQGGFGGGGMGGGGGQGGGGMGGGGAGMPQFKMPSIPKWFWTTLILVIIPLLCCCCCLYCCCCRGKGGGATASPQMGPDGQPMNGGGGGQRRGGGCGQFFNTFAASGIGSMAGRMISQMMSGGGRRQGGGGGMGMGGMGGGGGGYQGGGAYPADRPVYDDNGGQGGAGLYPSRAVKDQGGGGSWA